MNHKITENSQHNFHKLGTKKKSHMTFDKYQIHNEIKYISHKTTEYKTVCHNSRNLYIDILSTFHDICQGKMLVTEVIYLFIRPGI